MMIFIGHSQPAIWFGAIALGLTVGCTSNASTAALELIDVQGTITENGQPVPRTIVLFVPDVGEGSRARGITDQLGRYRLINESDAPGAEPGTYRVIVQPLRVRSEDTGNTLIDTVFGDADTTPLRATVGGDQASFDFELNSAQGES